MTLLLDTNVLSELVQPRPEPKVLENFRDNAERVAIAAIVWHELLFGLERLPPSRRKRQLHGFLWGFVHPSIPILAYDDQAAAWHSAERARLTSKGRTPSFADGQIASIAAVHNLLLVTRNRADFKDFRGLNLESWH